jgi:type I restriction enzyme S subunit
MQSNYKPIGDYIQLIDNRNTDLAIKKLLGINIDKFFMPSVANIVDTDLSKYKIVKKNQFACNRMHVGRDYRIPIAKSENDSDFIVSPAYDVFEIIDQDVLLSEYLMMWFKRAEFDRNAWFYTDGDVRGGLSWNDFCNIKLPIPSLTKQQEAVYEYNIIQRRIDLNKQLCEKLEETAQTLYRKYFVDDFDEENLPEGWRWGKLGEVAIISMGQSPIGESYNSDGLGEIFYQGRSDFGNRYPTIRMFTDEPTKIAKQGDVLLSVRAPVGDINIAPHNCCIGRGLASIRNKRKHKSYMFYLTKSLKSDFSIAASEGTIFGSINRETLININIIIPDENVVQRFEKEVLNIDRLYENINLEINKLKEILSLLLSKIGRKDKLL